MAKQLNSYQVNLQFTADVKAATAQLKSLQDQLNTLATASINNSAGTGFSAEITKSAMAVQQLKTQLQEATNVNTGKLDLSKFTASLKASNMDLNKYATILKSLGPEGSKAFSSLATAITQSEMPLRRTNALLTETWTTLKNTARWQFSSSILHGFVGAVQSAYGYAQDLNESLNNIRIVTGQSTDQMAKFAVQANKAAKELSTTTTKYTDAALIYYQQGLDDDQVKERTDITVKIANVAKESAETVSDQMTAVWNNFYDGSQSLEHYADAMVRLGADTASSSDEIAGGLEKFAAVAGTIGLSFDNAAAALATITATTRQSEDVVGTALKTIFARIQGLNLGETLDDGTTLNQYSQALEKVGVNIKDQSGQLKDMDDILDELGSKWGSIDKAEQVALAQQVAGVRQYTQLIALMDNYDYYQENLQRAQNSDGSLEKQAEIYAESWEAAGKRVKASLQTIYDSLLDDNFFIKLTDGAADLLDITNGIVKSLGGAKGLLLGISTLILTKMRPEITKSISDMTYGIQTALGKTQSENIATKKEANSILATMGDPNTIAGKSFNEAYSKQSDLQDTYLANAEKISEAEQKIASRYMDQQKILIKNVELQAQETELAEKQSKNAKSSAQGQALREVASFYSTNTEERNKEYANVRSQFNNIEQSATAYGRISQYQDMLGTFGTIDTSTLDQLENKLKECKVNAEDFSKAFGEKGKIAFEKFTKALSSKNIDDVNESLYELNDEMAKEAKYQDLVQELKKYYETLTDDEEAQRKFNSALDDFASKADKVGQEQQVLINNQSVLSNFTDAAKNAIEEMANQAATMNDSFVSLAGGLSSFGMVTSQISGIVDTFKDDSIDISDKIIGITSSLGFLIPSMNSLVKNAKESRFFLGGLGAQMGIVSSNSKILSKSMGSVSIAGKDVAITLASVLGGVGALIAVGAAIAGVVFIIKSAINEYNKAENALNNSIETADKLKDTYEELSNSAEDFKNKVSDYNTAIEALEGLDKTTQQYKDSLEEANEKAKELIETYNLWGRYSTKAGQIVFDTGVLEEVQNQKNTSANNLKAVEQSARITVQQNKITSQAVDLGRQVGQVKFTSGSSGNLGNYTNNVETIAKMAGEAKKESQQPGNNSSPIELFERKLKQWGVLQEESIEKILDSSDAFFSLADSINKATEASDYYAKEILGVKVENERSDQVENITSDETLQQYIYDAEAQVLKINGYDLTNLEIGSYKYNKDVGAKDDEDLARIYAQKVLGKTENELSQYIYEDDKNKGTLRSISGDTLFEGLSDDFMREAIARTNAIEKATEGISDSEILSNFENAVDELLDKTDTFGEQFGVNFSQVILNSLSNPENGIDLSEILSQLTPEDYENLKSLTPEQLKDILGLTDEAFKNLGIEDSEAWLNSFKESLNNYSEESYFDLITEAGKTGERNASNLISGLQSGDITKDNITSNEDYTSLINQLDILKKEYPELESAALELSNVWNVGSQTYLEALEKVQDKMAEIKLNDLAKEVQDEVDSITEKDKNGKIVFKSELDSKELQKSISDITSKEYAVNVEIHTQAEQEFDSITNAIKDMNTQASKIGENYVIAASDIRSLNNAFPGIIEGMTMLKDGSAQLKESVVKDSIDAARAEITADAESTVKRLDNQATLLEAKAKNYQNIADAATKLSQTESLSAQESAALRSTISNNLAQLTATNSTDTTDVELDNQEKTANSSKDNAGIVATNWNSAFKSAAQSSVDFANTAISNMKKAASGKGKGTLVGSFKVDYQGSTGISEEAAVLEETQKALDDVSNSDEAKKTWAKIAAEYTSLAESTLRSANDIRGMIAQVGATVGETEKTFKDLGKAASSTSKELQKVAERYHEINREIQYQQKLLDELSDAKDRLYGKDRLDNLDKEIEANQKIYDLQNQLYDLVKANVIVDQNTVQKQFGGKAKFNEKTLEIENYTKLYDSATTDEQREALEQYEETLDKLREQESTLIDLKNTLQDLHYEKLTYELEIKIKLNENDLKELEYYFDKLSDNIYKAAEALGYLQGQFDPTIEKLGNYENFYNQLNDEYAAGNISQQDYIDGLQDSYDSILDNLEALQDLDDKMLEYYGNTIDLANDELSKYTDHMEHLTSVLDHYRSIITLLGKDKDYKQVLSVLNGTAQTKKNEFNTSKQWYESLKRERDAAEAALANAGSDEEREALQKNYDAILAAFDEAEEDMLSKAEEYGEALKTILTTKMEEAADEMNKKLSSTKVEVNGNNFNISGWDALNDALDRMSSYQDEYLTKTNQIYEMNKMLNDVNQAIDKTDNQAAKNRYQQFSKEIEQLRDKDKLSQLELDIAQAKYKVLEAQIALEEAQNAKSTVRLQRDNEGNFGYVYTADQEKVNDAEQALADAENDLYNIRLNATNKYGQQKLQYEKELSEKLAELDKKAAEDAIYRETDYQAERALVIQQYTDLITTAGNLYALAQEEDSRVVQDAWVNSFDIIKENSDSWKDTITENTEIINDAFKEWQSNMDEISDIVGKDLEDTQQKVKDVTDESNNLYDEISNKVIPALEDELSAVRSASEAWAEHRQELMQTISYYEQLLQAIKNTIAAQSGMSGSSSSDADWSEKMGGVEYGSDEYNKFMQNREDKINGGYDVGTATNARVDAFYKKGYTLPKTVNGTTYNYFPEIPDSVWKTLVGFRSGGYTGSWGEEGKLAFLHQKELVLNSSDTENILASIGIVRQIAKQLDLNSQQFSSLSSSGFSVSTSGGSLEQNVRIEASFPNATDKYEIQEAFNTLVNMASQYANRK